MCKPHWFMVPQLLRNAVWNTYDHGRGLLTDAYKTARQNAIDAVNDREIARAKARSW